ncbi:MAG: hypothetical protein ACM31K_01455 [Solirubrobacterales bacterium]
MISTPVPHAKQVRDLLSDLLGKDVEVTLADPMKTQPGDKVSVAIYTGDRLQLGAVMIFDLPLSAYLGAALGLVAPGGARAAVEDGELPANLEENLGEVVNIAAALFNVPGAPHLKLHQLLAPGSPLPADVVGVLSGIGGRLDLSVEVPNYGSGRMSVVLAA